MIRTGKAGPAQLCETAVTELRNRPWRKALLAILLMCVSAGPVAAADFSATASYMVSLGGTNVATAKFTLAETARRYRLALDASVTGIAQLVASAAIRATSSGVPDATGLDAQQFDVTIRSARDTVNVQIAYGSTGDVTAFLITPPIVNTIDRVPIERKQLGGVTDMLAAFVLRGSRLDGSLCDRKMQIFSGIERFTVGLRFGRNDTATSRRTGYQGPVIVCSVDYTPISGHYTSSDITKFLAGNDRMLIWYAPLRDTGYFIPYRVLINTEAGDLSMVLTELG